MCHELGESAVTYHSVNRCAWVGNDPIMINYHDAEWGVVTRDRQRLFEALLLEGAQAGLSWRTVLHKRAAYRDLFWRFRPERIAAMTSAEIDQVSTNPGIIRHRGKVNAFVANARAWLQLEAQGSDPVELLWQFVDDVPRQNQWQKLAELPTQSKESVAMSKTLKKAGFKFVGPTTCYAFMQSVGMVNDHLYSCFRYHQLGGSGD